MRILRSCLIAALMLALAGPPTALAVDSEKIADNTYDIVVLRTLASVSFLVGSVFFVPTALLTAPAGRDGFDEAYEVFIEPQWDSLAKRPLGEF